MYRLEFADDLGRRLGIDLPDDQVEAIVGRDATCDVVLAHASVSRRHARILFGDNLAVEDLGSANGVYVNNQRVHGPTPIRPGDEIIFGDRRFVLRPALAVVRPEDTVDLVMEKQGNRVLAQYLDGRSLRGSTLDLGGSPEFHILNAQGVKLPVNFSELKALYFLKSRLDPESSRGRYGRKVLLKFQDGELLIGSSFDYTDEADRFFVFPLDDDDPNERVLVNRAAVSLLRVLGVTYGLDKDPDPIVPGQKQRNRAALAAIAGDAIYETALIHREHGRPTDETAVRTWATRLDKALSNVREEFIRSFGRLDWRRCLDEAAEDVGRLLGEEAGRSTEAVTAVMSDQG